MDRRQGKGHSAYSCEFHFLGRFVTFCCYDLSVALQIVDIVVLLVLLAQLRTTTR